VDNPYSPRYVYTAHLRELQPNTTYYFSTGTVVTDQVVVGSAWDEWMSAGAVQQKIPFTRERKFRSLPDAPPYEFVAGGDIGTSYSARTLLGFAGANMPHLFLAGGDLAYDNSVCACYHVVDLWLSNLETLMGAAAGGYSIPLLPVIGNHDAGGYFQKAETAYFYFRYFPSEDGLEHNASRAYDLPGAKIIVLDSNHVDTVASQRSWLLSQLRSAPALKIATYHFPIWPLRPMGPPMGDFIPDMKDQWVTLFDDNNLTLSLEFHLHGYKRTKPLKYGQVVASDEGVIYIGDGCMGATESTWPVDNGLFYLERAALTSHYLRVLVGDQHIKVEARDLANNVFDSWERDV
jgi:hypothetical protein